MKILNWLFALPLMANGVTAQNVACVGNSITYGYGLNWGTSYPNFLQEMMPEGAKVDNFGVSGMTFAKSGNQSYWSTDRFTAAMASNPNIVVIELGTNDSKFFMGNNPELGIYNYMYGMETVDNLKADYRSLIDTFAHLESHPDIWATLQPYSNNASWTITDTAIVSTINPIIFEASVEKGVNIIDLHTLFRTPDWFLDDSVHPNENGAKELARIVYEHITASTPVIEQDGNVLKVKSAGKCYWYKNGTLIDGANADELQLTEVGSYKALVKINEETESYLLTSEVDVQELDSTMSTVSTNYEQDTPLSCTYVKGMLYLQGSEHYEELLITVIAPNGQVELEKHIKTPVSMLPLQLRNGLHIVAIKSKGRTLQTVMVGTGTTE